MDIKTAVKIVEQMENDVESLCKCCMPKGAHCIGCREIAITTVLNELKKKDEVINKAIKFIEKAQLGEFPDGVIYWLKDDEVGKNLLQILEDKEADINVGEK